MRPQFKPFKYKMPPRPPRMPLNRIETAHEGERLTGFVHGKEAKATEERHARALDAEGKDYQFQVEVTVPTTIPGQENMVDFLVEDVYPQEIDGEWIHHTAAKKAQDEMRDAIIDNHMAQYGWQPIQRIRVSQEETQEDYDRRVQEMF